MVVPAALKTTPTVRLYGGAVAVVAGAYAIWLATDTMEAVGARPLLAVGALLVVHGLALFTRVAPVLGRINGLAMLAYAGALFVVQGWREELAEATAGFPNAVETAGADPGLVALAALVLFSGAIMSVRREMLD